MNLIRIPSMGLDTPPVYIDPDDVVGIHSAGCSVISRKSSFVLLVQGTPDDVYALLAAPPVTEPD